MEVVGDFPNSLIDQEGEDAKEEKQEPWEEKTIVGKKKLHLKGNTIPRGLVPI